MNIDYDEYIYEVNLSALQWTTTPPTRPGWYWVIQRAGGERYGHPAVAEVVKHHWVGITELVVKLEGSLLHVSEFTHWLGPLPVPEPPQ